MGKSKKKSLPKQRNLVVKDMILRGSPSAFRDKREKRANERALIQTELDADMDESPFDYYEDRF